MDNYNAKTIIELIGSVVPQLARNRKEDISNGIKITTKKDKNKSNKNKYKSCSIAIKKCIAYRRNYKIFRKKF